MLWKYKLFPVADPEVFIRGDPVLVMRQRFPLYNQPFFFPKKEGQTLLNLTMVLFGTGPLDTPALWYSNGKIHGVEVIKNNVYINVKWYLF